ncbi:MAG: hypothetical protein ACO1RA_11570 [Planctomycetaceae bacterium]
MIAQTAFRASLILSLIAAIFSVWLLTSSVGEEIPHDSDASLEELEAELKTHVASRNALLRKVEEILINKRHDELLVRRDNADAIVEMTPNERARYNWALKSFQALYSKGPENLARLCLHLEEKEVIAYSSRTTPSYPEGFPTARVLMELEPRTGENLVGIGSGCKTPKMRFLVGALLNELDGFELAKARLDIKIKELTESKDAAKERTIESISNLQAIRKIYDKKDAFEAKRK